MKQHKWAKEIKAWLYGAEIEFKLNYFPKHEWIDAPYPDFNDTESDFRIKPQPKEPQYLYVWKDGQHNITLTTNPPHPAQNIYDIKVIGKIKLENDDEE